MRYPFSPEVLDALPEELAELFRSLEETLLDEICSRLKLAGELNEVTVQDIRALRSHGIGLKEIERAIQRTANISEQRLNRLLEDVVEEQARGMSVRPEDKAFIATLYKYMFVGLMLDWVKADMKGDPQVIVDRLEQVIHGSIRAALERLRTDKPLSNAAE